MRIVGLFALAILFPAFAHATVVINEIAWMGIAANSNAEWIELANSGSDPVDLSGWKLTSSTGAPIINLTGTVVGNGYYLLERNTSGATIGIAPSQPVYTGALVNSGTNLTVTLTDASGTTRDKVLGGNNWENIGGTASPNYETAQRTATGWTTAAPTPGAANADDSSSDSSNSNSDTSSDVTNTTNTTTSVTTSSSSGSATTRTSPPSALTVDAGANQDAVMEVPLHLFAHVVVKGGAVDPNAQIQWGFGDGSSAEGSVVEKTYRYAGTYLIVVTATDGQATGRDEFIVTVRPAQVRILEIPDTGIVVTNDTNERLDLSGWALFADKSSFRVPSGTVLLPKANVLFSSTITKLPTAPEVTLAYPNGGVAARYVVSSEPIATTTSVSALDAQLSSRTASYEQVQAVEPAVSTSVSGAAHEKTAVSAPAATTELAAAGAALPPPMLSVGAPTSDVGAARAFGIFKSPWALSFLGVVVLAGSAFIFL